MSFWICDNKVNLGDPVEVVYQDKNNLYPSVLYGCLVEIRHSTSTETTTLVIKTGIEGSLISIEDYNIHRLSVLTEGKAPDIANDVPDQQETIGKKFSDDKPRFTLIDPWVEEQCAKARLMGNKKYCPQDYTDTNWMNVEPPEQYLDAAYRHMNKHRQGEVNDEESGLPHLIHAITNLQMYSARVLK